MVASSPPPFGEGAVRKEARARGTGAVLCDPVVGRPAGRAGGRALVRGRLRGRRDSLKRKTASFFAWRETTYRFGRRRVLRRLYSQHGSVVPFRGPGISNRRTWSRDGGWGVRWVGERDGVSKRWSGASHTGQKKTGFRILGVGPELPKLGSSPGTHVSRRGAVRRGA